MTSYLKLTSEINHISRNSLSVHLIDCLLHSHQIAARRLRRMAGGGSRQGLLDVFEAVSRAASRDV